MSFLWVLVAFLYNLLDGGKDNRMLSFIIYITIFLYLIYLIWITEPLFIKNKYKEIKEYPSISIIISARNESNNIKSLIKSLSQQTYPKDKYEIIIINDKSTDDTLIKLESFQKKLNNLIIINIKETPKDWASKKWALNKGIDKASGNIIIQTDADCIHQNQWIESMAKPFLNQNIGFVAGPSYIGIENNFINELLKLESIAQESFSYANSKRQLFISCTARNIAYRQKVFQEIGGYNDIAHINSGDDDLLLHKIATQTKWDIHYIANNLSLVSSTIPQTIKSLYLQRLRYASKGLLYYNLSTPNEVKIILPFLYFTNLMCVISILQFISIQTLFWFIPLIIKSIAEIILISKYMSKIKINFRLLYFIILMVVHPFYVIIFGGLAPFLKVQWK
jgi:cellulose synthase/poly-beta-1,6-N-acetylglucosamine synthase-like glycosyltransferase